MMAAAKPTDSHLPEHCALENMFQRQLSAERRQQLCARQSPRRPPPVRPDVTDDARVDGGNERQDPEIQRQMDELDRHRQTVKKMSYKIIDLHAKMTELEKQNGDLRRQLDGQLYGSKPDVDHDNLDKLSHDDLARRYSMVKNKLHRQTATLNEYKQKVLELQKKLIEKNEQEKEYLKQQDSFRSQTDLLKRLQDKTDRVNGLKDGHKKQTQVIAKLEKRTGSKNSHNNDNNDDELRELRQQQQAAQHRIQALEKQLAENSRRWSREKTEMSLQLQEAKHGLVRPSPSHRLSPIPSFSDSRQDVKPGRQQQQPNRHSHPSTH